MKYSPLLTLLLAATALAQSPLPTLDPPQREVLPALQVEPPIRLPVPPEPVYREPEPVTAGLTLLELEHLALSNHPGLLAMGARIRAAEGARLQAGLPPNPTIGYSGGEIGNDGTAGMQGMFVGQTFITGGKLALNRRAAQAEVFKAQQQFEAWRLRVVNDVRRAYFDALVAQHMVELAERLVGVAADGQQTSQRLFDAMEVSRIDVLQARIEKETAEIELQNARNRHRAAWQNLQAVVAAPRLKVQSLTGDPSADLPTFTWEDSLERLLAESPELAAAQAEVQRAQWALRRAIAEPIPDVNAQGGVQYDYGTDTTVANVQISVPIPLVNRNQGNIQQARAQLTAAQADVSRVELALHQRLAQAFELYANARNQVDRYQKTILPQAEETLELVRTGYQQGEFDYITLLNAQRTYFQSNQRYLAALQEFRRAAVALQGLLLADSLQSPE